ncbi:MAG: hypothetical protein ABWX92_02900 [Mycetocola sp.]
MAKKPTTTITVEITEAQRNFVISGLYNELLDAERYIAGSKEADKPGPLDSCCPEHLARYEHRKEMHQSLKQRKKAVEATIALFEGNTQ